MARIAIAKVVKNRTTAAKTIYDALSETCAELFEYTKITSEADETPESVKIMILTIEQRLPEALRDAEKLPTYLERMRELCARCEYTDENAEAEPRAPAATQPSVQDTSTTAAVVADAAAPQQEAVGPLKKIGGLIERIQAGLEHLARRIGYRSRAASLASAKKNHPRIAALLNELVAAAAQWKDVFVAHLTSPHFAERIVAPDSQIDLYEDEVYGKKKQKELFFSTHMPESYKQLQAENDAIRTMVLDSRKYDERGLPRVETSSSAAAAAADDGFVVDDARNGNEDSDASVNSNDFADDDETDPDAAVQSEDEEDSVADNESDSAAVSDMTRVFEYEIATKNEKVLAATKQTTVKRNGRRLRSSAWRDLLERESHTLVKKNERTRRRKRPGGASEDKSNDSITLSDEEEESAENERAPKPAKKQRVLVVEEQENGQDDANGDVDGASN